MPTEEASSPFDLELDFLHRLRPDERFSHVSAARIWGMPLPLDADARVHLTTPVDHDRRERHGLVSHRRGGETLVVSGMPVSSPLETFVELAKMLALDDLVAVGDWIALTPRHPGRGDQRPYATPDSLRRTMNERRAWGVRLARRAADLVTTGVESPQETRLRLLLTRAGIVSPRCGMPIRDRDGALIGYFDMVWPEERVIVEYDGDQHRTDPTQYEKDILRFDRATAAGWRVIRIRKLGLRRAGEAETIARVREAFALPRLPRYND